MAVGMVTAETDEPAGRRMEVVVVGRRETKVLVAGSSTGKVTEERGKKKMSWLVGRTTS